MVIHNDVCSLHRRCYFTTSSLTFRSNFVIFSELWKWRSYVNVVGQGNSWIHKIQVIGRQPDSDVYVLGPNAIFDSNGNVLCTDECDVVWVSDIVSGEGVASYNLVCDVLTPMSVLFEVLPKVFKHNTAPAMLMLGTACMTFHYGIVLSTKKCFPVPLASGCSGTWKTLALRCALALYGAHNKHVYQHCTLQYYTSRCSGSSIPFGIDDPSHSKELGELMLSVFNGTMTGNISREEAIDLSHLQSSLPTSLCKIKPQGTCMHHNTHM